MLLTIVVRFAIGDFDGWERPFGVVCIGALAVVIALDLWRPRQRKRTGQN